LGTGINYVGLDLENREIVELQMLNHAVLLEILWNKVLTHMMHV